MDLRRGMTALTTRSPDLRIVARRPRLPAPYVGRCSVGVLRRTELQLGLSDAVADRAITRPCGRRRTIESGRLLPADSGGTVWDFHPASLGSRASVGCKRQYSMAG